MSHLLREVQLQWQIIPITYECRRPNFDVDAKQQEVLMPTPSRVVTVEVLINDQALSTQDPQGAITHSAICPLLGLLLLHQLHLNARWPSSLPVQVLLSSNAHALSYKGTQTYLKTGQYRALLRRLESCWTAPPLRYSRPYQPKCFFRFVFHFESVPLSGKKVCLCVLTSSWCLSLTKLRPINVIMVAYTSRTASHSCQSMSPLVRTNIPDEFT